MDFIGIFNMIFKLVPGNHRGSTKRMRPFSLSARQNTIDDMNRNELEFLRQARFQGEGYTQP